MSTNYYKLENLTILVVDDRRNMRSFIGDVLREIGIGKMLNCESYDDAIKVLEPPQGMEDLGVEMSASADIVIVDWLLEDEKTGLDLVKWIRAHSNEALRYLPIIMLSGYSERENILLARDAGANEFLTKPISIKRLVDRLLSVVDRPRPFVQGGDYFGPCRRRSNTPIDHPDRRQSTPATANTHESAA